MSIETVIAIIGSVILVCGIAWAIGVVVDLINIMQQRDIERLLRKLHEKSKYENGSIHTP